MDASAIKQIQEQTAIAEASAALAENVGQVALPNSFEILNLEQFREFRDRQRGNMTAETIDGFCGFANYAILDGYKNSSVFVNQDNMSAKFIADFGLKSAPGHCEYTATLELARTPEYRAICKAVHSLMTSSEIFQWCEEWAHIIEFLDSDKKPIGKPATIRALRNVRIKQTKDTQHGESDFGREKTDLEKIEASSVDPLPAYLRFNVAMYQELSTSVLIARFSILTEPGEEPRFKFYLLEHSADIEAAATEFSGKINTGISDTRVFAGSFR